MGERYVVDTIFLGYHMYMYMAVWEAAFGRILPCQHEGGSIHDPYAVAIVEGGVAVGHVPHVISSVCYLYPKKKWQSFVR